MQKQSQNSESEALEREADVFLSYLTRCLGCGLLAVETAPQQNIQTLLSQPGCCKVRVTSPELTVGGHLAQTPGDV